MMEETKAVLGGLESPEDKRDYDLGTVQAPIAIPAEFLPDVSTLPVYNQDQQPACGGHAGAKLQNILLGLGKDLSPRFVFALCKKIDGLPPEKGTYGRAIFQVLQKYGVCTNDLFPNDVTLPIAEYADWTKIPQAAFVDGLSRRIGPYAQVTDLSMDGLKQAIYQNKSVLVLKKPWTPASWSTQSNSSGHFFDLDGYSETLRFTNSFGLDWQNHGEGELTEADIPTIIEAWTAYEPTPPVAPPLPPGPIMPDTISPWLAAVRQWLANVKAWLNKGRNQ
jgi:glutaredoxin-related protein